MLVDAHAHLDLLQGSPLLRSALDSNEFSIIVSNSVDESSSKNNVELARNEPSVRAFVGIHPEIFASPRADGISENEIRRSVDQVANMFPIASGIGEIGLDRKYGSFDLQIQLFRMLLEAAERTKLPLTIHSRETVSEINEMMTTYSLHGNVLFHWFAGSEAELERLQDLSCYVSFGPSLIFSKRLSLLFLKSDLDLTLPETDCPTPFRSLIDGPSNSFLVSSVIFKMAQVRRRNFKEMRIILETNASDFLRTQN